MSKKNNKVKTKPEVDPEIEIEEEEEVFIPDEEDVEVIGSGKKAVAKKPNWFRRNWKKFALGAGFLAAAAAGGVLTHCVIDRDDDDYDFDDGYDDNIYELGSGDDRRVYLPDEETETEEEV